MMRTTRQALEQAERLILRAWNNAVAAGSLTEAVPAMPSVDLTGDGAHGDLTSAFCLIAARAAGMEPRALADLLLRHMDRKGTCLSAVEAAGPGYLNFRLSDKWYADTVRSVAQTARLCGGKHLWTAPLSPEPGPGWAAALRRRALSQALENILERAGMCFLCIDDEENYVNLKELVPGPTRLVRSGEILCGEIPPGDLPLEALRFFLCQRLDRPVTVDLDLAAREDGANPLYRVRYTRDRISRVLQRLEDGELRSPCPAEADPPAPWSEEARSLIRLLSRWNDATSRAAHTADPGLVAAYLLQLADSFRDLRKELLPLDPQAPVSSARLNLCDAVRLVLEDGLLLLGVSI